MNFQRGRFIITEKIRRTNVNRKTQINVRIMFKTKLLTSFKKKRKEKSPDSAIVKRILSAVDG